MRDSINGVWVLGIVMVFMAIFVAFVAISINYSNAYTLKSRMVTIIEEYEGMNNESMSRIDGVLKDNGYLNRLLCPEPLYGADRSVYGITDMNAVLNPTTPQSYCVSRDSRSTSDSRNDFDKGADTEYYYTVTLAFAFDLPLLGELFDFKVSGETNGLLYVHDTLFGDGLKK